MESFNKMYGVPEKIKLDNASAFISKDKNMSFIIKTLETEFNRTRLRTSTGLIERAI